MRLQGGVEQRHRIHPQQYPIARSRQQLSHASVCKAYIFLQKRMVCSTFVLFSRTQRKEASVAKQDTNDEFRDRNAKRPVETLRDGWLKAAIWRNEGDRGAYYTTTLARTYRDDEGNLRDSQNFRNDDLLRLGELTRIAHHRTNELSRDEFVRRREEAGNRQQDRGLSHGR